MSSSYKIENKIIKMSFIVLILKFVVERKVWITVVHLRMSFFFFPKQTFFMSLGMFITFSEKTYIFLILHIKNLEGVNK